MAITSTTSSLLFVLFLCLLGSVSSLAIRETNADRFARGLTPLQPKGMERANRRATGTDSARRSMVSPLPPTTANGRLNVRNANGQSVGFVRNREGDDPISGINALSEGEPNLEVMITYSPSSPQQCNIHATNARFPAPYFVGASGGSGKLEGPRHVFILEFTNVPETLPGAHPSQVGTENTFIESAIWSFDPSTKELKAFWINDDSTTTEAILAHNARNNALFFVADIAAFNAAAGEDSTASPVKLYLV
ncbi:hypothetical protein BKA70DRAFT_1424274 [Coprinopsis sp. MPI-PUGE-AT-0042]|nr:hypothetical protein BKA70DRAFT_1424274 [Coprinopsis sp. MPI-PUGE-AT-0042]